MTDDTVQEGDVRGLCPRCNQPVYVYARSGQLRVRAHERPHPKLGQESCPVRDASGRAAIERLLEIRNCDVLNALAAQERAASVLANARQVEASARRRRDEYAAEVDALLARVANDPVVRR